MISYSSKNVAMHRRISINNLIVISRKILITWAILVQNDYFYLYFHDKNVLLITFVLVTEYFSIVVLVYLLFSSPFKTISLGMPKQIHTRFDLQIFK